MTRINTNVSSLIAQKTLNRSNQNLQESLTRLSTGLRINVGKDDPAGLIASETLRSNIVSVQRGITNSQRANQLIATADSALGQVSALLNDIRGLVSEAANTGALSIEQVKANQLQVDSSLAAIDRIAQTTQFQGRRLLDGSLDFITTSAGTADIKAAGTFGTTADANATTALSGTVGSLNITAKNAGTAYNGYKIFVTTGAAIGSETVAIDTGAKTITITDNDASTTANVLTALQNDVAFSALFSASVGTAGLVATAATVTTSAGVDGNTLVLTAATGGTAYNNTSVTLATGAATGSETAAYDTATNTLTVNLNDNSTAAQVRAAINTNGVFTAALTGSGLGVFTAGTTANVTTGGALGSANISDLRINQANFGTASQVNVRVDVDTQATQGKLVYSGGTLASDLVLEIGGQKGFNVFNFGNSSTITQIATAINQLSDATGVTANVNGANLELKSSEYGSAAFVSARALSGTFNTVDTVTNTAKSRVAGTDIAVRINGIKATGQGLRASLNTSTLDLTFSVNSAVVNASVLNFSITGGGANFQLGPEVVSNQQARLGIQGVSTATLGGVSGTLFELRSGGGKSLEENVKGAASVVNEVIVAVTNLRGRLGAFQKTTLDTNIFTLNDTLANLTDAESSIRDADFAAESAKLTQAQILVQSGTSVLQIANQRPQSVLALLRG